ncbi:uncharacterized protein LOC119367018 [Triticum dicoccoides]|nr:uncharacterized protein LOC119367018 [Triticum dicoccoides]
MACRRPTPPSPSLAPAPVPPLEDDDLLEEILLRLPPQPSSLLRASLVSKRWRGLVKRRRFLRLFRARHGSLPLLVVFPGEVDMSHPLFTPSLDPPDRVPAAHFPMPLAPLAFPLVLDCRHGHALLLNRRVRQLLAWDPVTGDKRPVDLPPAFKGRQVMLHNGSVLCASAAAAEGRLHGSFNSSPFKVVLLASGRTHERSFSVCVYSSQTGAWGDVISAEFQPAAMEPLYTASELYMYVPSTLVGSSIYWLLRGNGDTIVEFDMGSRSLAMIEMPLDLYDHDKSSSFMTMPAQDGGLGLILVNDFYAKLWKRGADCNGVAIWVPGITIQLGKLLSLNAEHNRGPLSLLGFSEDSNAFVAGASRIGIFVVYLNPLRFKKIHERRDLCIFHPFESFCVAGI